MGKLTLFGVNTNPPCQAVLLTLNALNLSYDYVDISIFTKEELSQEFYAKHGREKVPTLEDDEVSLYDSHAILTYLAEKYGETDVLYPKDLMKRAIVDSRLYFESSTICFNAFGYNKWPILMKGKTDLEQYKLNEISDVYRITEVFLQKNPYIAGENMTIADLNFMPFIMALDALVPINPCKYVQLIAWTQRMRQLPYYEEACGTSADEFTALVKEKKIKIKK